MRLEPWAPIVHVWYFLEISGATISFQRIFIASISLPRSKQKYLGGVMQKTKKHCLGTQCHCFFFSGWPLPNFSGCRKWPSKTRNIDQNSLKIAYIFRIGIRPIRLPPPTSNFFGHTTCSHNKKKSNVRTNSKTISSSKICSSVLHLSDIDHWLPIMKTQISPYRFSPRRNRKCQIRLIKLILSCMGI